MRKSARTARTETGQDVKTKRVCIATVIEHDKTVRRRCEVGEVRDGWPHRGADGTRARAR